MTISIQRIDIPDFGRPAARPALGADIFNARMERFLRRIADAGYDAAAVYGDREHFANIRYLAGFDPRFEEALFVVHKNGERALLLGNECLPAAANIPVPCPAILYQDFSLPGQDRSKSADLPEALAKAGLKAGMRIALLGWKPLSGGRLEVPHFVVAALEKLTGKTPENANDILMGVNDGLRLRVEPEQLADFEFSGCAASDSLFRILAALRPGLREFEAASLVDTRGVEHAYHPIAKFGRAIPYALVSPGMGELEPGDYASLAVGPWGTNVCRVGLAAQGPIGGERENAYLKVVRAYLKSVRAWYAALSSGAKGGDVFAAADKARDGDVFAFALNPGHYIHLDEWLNSPFAAGSDARLPSMSAVQSDIIPVPAAKDVCVNMEDPVAVADETDRAVLKERFPGLHERCLARRDFMRSALGYEVSDDVLPLANMPGAFFPWLMDKRQVCAFKA